MGSSSSGTGEAALAGGLLGSMGKKIKGAATAGLKALGKGGGLAAAGAAGFYLGKRLREWGESVIDPEDQKILNDTLTNSFDQVFIAAEKLEKWWNGLMQTDSMSEAANYIAGTGASIGADHRSMIEKRVEEVQGKPGALSRFWSWMSGEDSTSSDIANKQQQIRNLDAENRRRRNQEIASAIASTNYGQSRNMNTNVQRTVPSEVRDEQVRHSALAEGY